MSRDHAGLLAEHGEQLGLPLVVPEEVAELLGDHGGLVLPAQLRRRRLQHVRLAQAQSRLGICSRRENADFLTKPEIEQSTYHRGNVMLFYAKTFSFPPGRRGAL